MPRHFFRKTQVQNQPRIPRDRLHQLLVERDSFFKSSFAHQLLCMLRLQRKLVRCLCGEKSGGDNKKRGPQREPAFFWVRNTAINCTLALHSKHAGAAPASGSNRAELHGFGQRSHRVANGDKLMREVAVKIQIGDGFGNRAPLQFLRIIQFVAARHAARCGSGQCTGCCRESCG